ncbi:MAG: hypothetical protein ACREF8_00375, partial [Chthoniobacterales bacterium]
HMQKAIVLKKSEALERVEVAMPSDEAITRLMNERIAEMLADAQTADLQPFFEKPEVAEAMRRTQHVIERRKFVWLFEKWGCLICERKDARHAGLGMCPACLSRTRERLNGVKREHAADAATEGFRDAVRSARKDVLP